MCSETIEYTFCSGSLLPCVVESVKVLMHISECYRDNPEDWKN